MDTPTETASLRGSQTEKNLVTAATESSRNATRYELYASRAYGDAQATVGDQLRDLAHQEKEHAALWYDSLGELGDSRTNLAAAITGESYDTDALYPEYARIAENEGFDEIAEKFRLVGGIAAGHRDILRKLLTGLEEDTLYAGAPEDTQWFCTNCGYVSSGSAAPERCPVCSYPRGYFLRYDDHQ